MPQTTTGEDVDVLVVHLDESSSLFLPSEDIENAETGQEALPADSETRMVFRDESLDLPDVDEVSPDRL